MRVEGRSRIMCVAQETRTPDEQKIDYQSIFCSGFSSFPLKSKKHPRRVVLLAFSYGRA